MEKNSVKNFFLNILRGVLMGIALIIPGFSGGTVAVVLGVYYGLVSAVSGLFKHFVKNFLYLLPFAIGMAAAVASLIFPIQAAFEYLPLPTICLFVGLMLGGVPPIAREAGKPNKFAYILSFAIACAAAVALCFVPRLEAVSSAVAPDVGTYFALVGVGFVGACGFVVPGISGSMILMVLGYYDYVLGAGAGLLSLNEVGDNLLILLVFAVGVIVGFFAISFLMKVLLTRFKRGTYYAILGFIAGSVFTLFWNRAHDEDVGMFNPDMSVPLQIVFAALLLAIGFTAAYMFCRYAEGKDRAAEVKEPADAKAEQESADGDKK